MATTELTRSPETTRPALGRLRIPAELRAAPVRLIWVATRAAMMVVLGLLGGPVTGDVLYYARSMHGIFAGGSIRETLQEYPVPVLSIMLPQYLLGALNSVAFAFVFVASMLAFDAAFTWLLWRMTGRRRSEAVTFWLCFAPALGPIAYCRFDLVPAVLAGAALFTAVRRPMWTGVLTAFGAALKLWPAVMLPVFLIRREGRGSVIRWFAITGVAFGLLSLVIAGVSRSVSPLHWQAARGLQIESVVAAPLMLARSVHTHGTWDIRTSTYKATEIFGPGAHAMLTVSTIATIAGLLLLIALWCRTAITRNVPLSTLAWLVLAAAALLTVVNKTLSPQYVLWFGGPMAALIAFAPRDASVRRAARVVLALSLVTQLIYPIGYSKLVNVNPLTFPMTLVLTLRNALLIWLAWLACAEVWRRTGRGAREDAS